MNNYSISRAFDDLKKTMFIPYKGCNIARENGGFEIFGQYYQTLQEAEQAIDNRYILFNNIIKNQNS